MKLLFTIPHYFASAGTKSSQGYGSCNGNLAMRLVSFQACLDQLSAHFINPLVELDNSTGLIGNSLNRVPSRWEVDIAICTAGDQHLLHRIRTPFDVRHVNTSGDPEELGFECHLEMSRSLQDYDYFCYLEDAILILDPGFFDKQSWFNHVFGNSCVLQPNRYELHDNRVKVYVDGPLPSHHVRRYCNLHESMELSSQYGRRNLSFVRSTNPLSACFFLNRSQMQRWAESPIFNERDQFLGSTLESAQILGPLRLFRVYKPALPNADFLEVIHSDARLTRLPTPRRELQREFRS